MARRSLLRAVAVALVLGAAAAALPGLAQTPTPTATPTVTPTPLPVAANVVTTICSISSASSVCGRVRKAASQATTAAYLFQVTASGASYNIWVSCDDAAGGTSKRFLKLLTFKGESVAVPVSEVGPCTLGVTPKWTAGTSTLALSISGDHALNVLPTPSP